jgi:mannan endo-1,4-beta-mannosidase
VGRGIGALVLLLLAMGQLAAQIYRYEAEDGQLYGTQVANSVPGYSGTGYVTSFDGSQDHFQLLVDVPAGLYEMWVGYRSVFGEKGYDFRVDQVAGSGMFDQATSFAEDRAGLFRLASGTNLLEISRGWGYYDVDYLEFRPFKPPPRAPIASRLNDPLADASTQVLMNYLASQYGHKTLAGQQHEVSENLSFPVADYLAKSGGLIPAIRGSDLIDYSPSRVAFGENPRNETEQSIAWAQQTGGIVTMMWHWNAPDDLINVPGNLWWRGFYSDATTFDLPGALANPAGDDYQKLIGDIDVIAQELQKFEDAGVPLLWRPLHEAQGGWFWWGAHGPETFKQLWSLMHHRLTQVHGLHNLIWEFTAFTSGDYAQWYPGDDVVDLVGLDIYTNPADNMSGSWYDALQQFDGRKMIALSETGTLPNPDEMDQWGIEWSYFMPWAGEFVDAFSAGDLQEVLGHEDIVTLDELPVLPWKTGGNFLSADFNFDGRVDLLDLARWHNALAIDRSADADGDRDTDGGDFLRWQAQFGGANAAPSAQPVPEPSAVGLVLAILLGGASLGGATFRVAQFKKAG